MARAHSRHLAAGREEASPQLQVVREGGDVVAGQAARERAHPPLPHGFARCQQPIQAHSLEHTPMSARPTQGYSVILEQVKQSLEALEGKLQHDQEWQ